MNEYTHFFLYAKGWYVKDNLVQDLRKLMEHYTDTSSDFFSTYDVLHFVATLVYPYVNEAKFVRLIIESVRSYNQKSVSDITDEILQEMLSILALIEVKDIKGGLGKPDPAILPLR